MPRTITIEEVLALDPGETIPQTRGVLKAVFDRKTGEKDGNPWSIQNCILAEGQTEIKVKAWNHDDLLPMKGRQVWLIANKNQKDGKLNGLTLIEEEYKGKTSKVIEARAKAEIVRADSPQPKPDDDDQIPGAEVPAQRTAPAAARPPSAKWQPMGATVGMAINNACANLTARNIVLNPTDVWEMASDILRVAERLEKGMMAPPWSQRNKQTTVDEIEPEPELPPDDEPVQDRPF